MNTVRLCAQCGKPIPTRRSILAIYCTDICANRAHTIRAGNRVDDTVSRNTRGAINELIISTDLMERGYHVYRALSPHCPCDLIAVKSGSLLRVEVKTGHYTVGHTPNAPSLRANQKESSDIVALVMPDGVLLYQPDIS